MDCFEDGEGECPIEATAIPSGFPILAVVLVEGLNFDVEPLIVDELVKHHS